MSEQNVEKLARLSQELGREERRLSILGEGNTSCLNDDGTFWVKASGSQMKTITVTGFARVRIDATIELMDRPGLDEAGINAGLDALRLDSSHKRPSVETFLHALCLSEGGAKWVGHTHTESVLQVLCSKHGAEPFRRHVYPDVIVVCGRHVAVVPYVDPGLELAQAVRASLGEFKARHGKGPKVILMESHGPVALGQTDAEVFNIMLMLEKWAKVIVGTHSMGGPKFMEEKDADRIDNRLDEAYRRARLLEAAKG